MRWICLLAAGVLGACSSSMCDRSMLHVDRLSCVVSDLENTSDAAKHVVLILCRESHEKPGCEAATAALLEVTQDLDRAEILLRMAEGATASYCPRGRGALAGPPPSLDRIEQGMGSLLGVP